MNFSKIEVGDIVEYKGLWYTVLGYAASKDNNGKEFIEIDWDNYLAVPEQDVMLKAKDRKYI